MLPQDWLINFPALQSLPADLHSSFQQHALPITAQAGDVLFHPGQACQGYAMLLEGSLKVQITSETGREITLYRVEAGQTCVQTATCLLSNQQYNAEGIAETALKAAMIPTPIFKQLLDQSAPFRQYVFENFGQRLSDMMGLVESFAFAPLETRLRAYLRQKFSKTAALNRTHQDIAADLGSAREVISRHLKQLEKQGILKLQRGCLILLDKTLL